MKNPLQYFNRSFSARFSLYILVLVGFIFLLAFGLFYRSSYRAIETENENNAYHLLNTAALKVENILIRLEKMVDGMKIIVEEGQLSQEELYQLTHSIVENNDDIIGCAIAFEPFHFSNDVYYFSPYSWRDGDSIRTKQLGTPEYDYVTMDWYQIPKLIEKNYWTEPYYDDGGGEDIIVTCGSRMVDARGKFIGIFTVDISLSWLSNVINEIELYNNAYSFVTSRGGTYIIHPQKERILNESTFSIALAQNDTIMAKIGKSMVKGETGDALITLDNITQYVFYRPLPRIEWSMGIVCPQSEVFKNLYRTNRTLLIIGILSMIIIFVVCSSIIHQLSAPLKAFASSAKQIAHGSFNVSLPVVHSQDEMKELHDAFDYLQHELTHYIDSLQQATATHEKMESELRIARDIQMGMIPKSFPVFGSRPEIDLHAYLKPARQVGGDLYDFFIQNDHLFFVIGDVSGKGIPASLFMAVTRSLFRVMSMHCDSSAESMTALNNAISENNESNMFVTLFLGILDLNTGSLQYCNAGHNALVFLNDKEVKFLEEDPNIAAGIAPDFQYRQQTLVLHHNDALFLYTDGITEAENAEHQLFGDETLLTSLRKSHNQHQACAPKTYANQLVDDVLHDVSLHVKDAEPSDDITMLAFRFHQPYYSHTFSLPNNLQQIDVLAKEIDQVGMALQMDESSLMQVQLAMEEVLSNILRYADPTMVDHIDFCVKQLDTSCVSFQIIDAGMAFDPTQREDPDITLSAEDRPIGGLGIFLVKKLMNEVSYIRQNDKNILTLKKNFTHTLHHGN